MTENAGFLSLGFAFSTLHYQCYNTDCGTSDIHIIFSETDEEIQTIYLTYLSN